MVEIIAWEEKGVMQRKRIVFIFVILVLSCVFFSGCGRINLLSSWRRHEINIDGKYSDWEESTAYYNEEAKLVLNLVNDADYIYICLISRNRAIEAKMMESGFILWFDPDGGRNKVLGIHFPIGGMSIEEDKRVKSDDWQDQEDKGGLIDREKERLRDRNFNKRLETLEGLQERMEIIIGSLDSKRKHPRPTSEEVSKGHTKKETGFHQGVPVNGRPVELSLEEARKLGIEAGIGRHNGYFVYELKVPIVKSANYPYAIEKRSGRPIGLGLEIESSRMKIMGNDRVGPEPPDGMFRGQEEFRLWMKIILSSAGGKDE